MSNNALPKENNTSLDEEREFVSGWNNNLVDGTKYFNTRNKTEVYDSPEDWQWFDTPKANVVASIDFNDSIYTMSPGDVVTKLLGKIVCVEGNIATGKTTFVHNMKNELAGFVASLKVEIVSEVIDESLLSKFNAEPKEFAYEVQDYMLQSRIEAIRNASLLSDSGALVLMDTGILREFVFSNANMTMGNLTKEEQWELWNKFTKLHDELGKLLPDAIVLLDCTSLRCMENIKLRNRANETTLSLKYIEEIGKWYNIGREDTGKSLNSPASVRFITTDVTSEFADVGVVLHRLM